MYQLAAIAFAKFWIRFFIVAWISFLHITYAPFQAPDHLKQ